VENFYHQVPNPKGANNISLLLMHADITIRRACKSDKIPIVGGKISARRLPPCHAPFRGSGHWWTTGLRLFFRSDKGKCKGAYTWYSASS